MGMTVITTKHCHLSPAAVGPFAQARDATQQEKEEERADSNLRKVTF
jgi:hypothetical protein